MSFAGMTLDKCIVLRIGTLTGCPLCRESHPLCRLKNPTVISIWLLVGFHPATRSVQSTPADNARKRVWQYIEKERKSLGGPFIRKKMLHNKFKKFKNNSNWENYRKQRNYVTKLRKQSIHLYFFERCSGGPKSKDFWPTIKPFLSSKSSKNDCDIILLENDTLIADQKEVSGLLNDFYINIAREIGIDSQSQDMANHPSIEALKENTPEQGYSSFNFKPVDQSLVIKSIKKLNPKKATGVDQLPAKLIKAGSTALAGPISTVFNLCADKNQFPNDLKNAQVRPIY